MVLGLGRFLLLMAIMAPALLLAPGDGLSQNRSKDLQFSGNREFEEARILYDNQQYGQALDRLKKAIQAPGIPKALVVDIYRYMGSIYIIQGKEKSAKRCFELLLKVNPQYEMNPLLTSPKILDFFNRTKEAVRQKERVIMQHSPPGEVGASERIELKVYVVDLHKRLDQIQIHYRRRGQGDFSSVTMAPMVEAQEKKGSLTYVGFIPFMWRIDQEVELFVEYYIAAVDRGGRWVANEGDPKQPLLLRINLKAGNVPEVASDEPLVEKWWFWTLIGVGAAGLGVGGYFLVTAADQAGDPSTGTAVLMVR